MSHKPNRRAKNSGRNVYDGIRMRAQVTFSEAITAVSWGVWNVYMPRSLCFRPPRQKHPRRFCLISSPHTRDLYIIIIIYIARLLNMYEKQMRLTGVLYILAPIINGRAERDTRRAPLLVFGGPQNHLDSQRVHTYNPHGTQARPHLV